MYSWPETIFWYSRESVGAGLGILEGVIKQGTRSDVVGKDRHASQMLRISKLDNLGISD